MSFVRFYIDHRDGTISDDQTYPLDPHYGVGEIRKGFSVNGEEFEIVIKFDPELTVPAPAEEE